MKIFLLIILAPLMIFSQNKDFVPEWAKKAVWYQIFPERFYNGDKANDPTIETITGSYPHDITSPWQVHPWTSDWYELQPYEKENGKNIWHNIQRRRYGGDLQGIISKLDYLKDLGINAIYLNPIFEAPSLHKYDGVTYHHVDPNFGPDPEGDRELIKKEVFDDPSTWVWTKADELFLKLVEEVHKRNMKIIIDGVFNHMSMVSIPFKDVVEKQEKSKYKDWFSIKSFKDSAKGTEFVYNGWFGVKELPELNEDKNGIVKGPKEYIFNITKRWMAPKGKKNLGIDGWRLDVAFCVEHKFWKDWRKQVKSINNEAYITAEVIDPIEVLKPYLKGDEFDAVMNYNFMFGCEEYFMHDKLGIKTSEFDRQLKDLRNAFPKGVAYVQQNLNNSHDTHRLLTGIVNKDKYRSREWGSTFDKRKGSNPEFDTRKPHDEEVRINKLMVIFQMGYVGAPYIYYGEETGMWGANDPDPRKPMIWKEFNYDSEKVLPDQSPKPQIDEVKFDEDLFNFYKNLIKIRNNNIELQLGDFKTLLTDDLNNVYSFSRKHKNQESVIIINNNSKDMNVTIPIKGKYKDLISGKEFSSNKDSLELKIDYKWGMMLKKIN